MSYEVYEYEADEMTFGLATEVPRLIEHLVKRDNEGWNLIDLHRELCEIPYAGEPPVTYRIEWIRLRA